MINAAAARHEQLERFGALCDALGQPPSAVALAWLRGQPGITATIIGPRTRDQLVSGLQASEIELDEEVFSRIEEIFPGCGPAPEAYAW